MRNKTFNFLKNTSPTSVQLSNGILVYNQVDLDALGLNSYGKYFYKSEASTNDSDSLIERAKLASLISKTTQLDNSSEKNAVIENYPNDDDDVDKKEDYHYNEDDDIVEYDSMESSYKSDVEIHSDDPAYIDKQFELFQKKYRPNGYGNVQRKEKAREAFRNTLKSITQHNLKYKNGLVSWYERSNEFSDMTEDEFEKILNLTDVFPSINLNSQESIILNQPYLKKDKNVDQKEEMFQQTEDYRENSDSRTIDYRSELPPVKNQNRCGSCWAFAASTVMEHQYFRSTGQIISFSEQQLVDCATKTGCKAGKTSTAFNYLKSHGIQTSESYPLESYHKKEDSFNIHSCRYDSNQAYAQVSEIVNLKPRNESQLRNFVAENGVVTCGVDARTFKCYGGGIYDGSCGNKHCSKEPSQLNHAMNIVGYGLGYFLLRNEWGEGWGEKGYMRIESGNTCGFNNLNRFATIKVLKLQHVKDIQDSGVPGTSELESTVITSDINKIPDPVTLNTEKPKQDPGIILVVSENPVIQETNILKPVSDTIQKPLPEPVKIVPPTSTSLVKPVSIPVKPIPGPVQNDVIKISEPVKIVPPTSTSPVKHVSIPVKPIPGLVQNDVIKISEPVKIVHPTSTSPVKPVSIPVKPIPGLVQPVFGPFQPKQPCYYLPLKCYCRPLSCYSRPLPCYPRPLLYALRPFPGCSKPTEVTPLFKIVERIIVNKRF